MTLPDAKLNGEQRPGEHERWKQRHDECAPFDPIVKDPARLGRAFIGRSR